VLLAVLLNGLIVGLFVGLLLSAEQRLKFSRQLASVVAGMIDKCPDE
jgi:uncharacterized membrane protein SpoIIM required for sporulation